MFVSVGDRGFGLAHVRRWDFDPRPAELRVWIGDAGLGPKGDEALTFHDEQALDVLEVLRRHAAASEATLKAMESLAAEASPVVG